MAEDKEIKLTAGTFELVIQCLTVYKNSLNSARDQLIQTDNNIKMGWIGDGGTAFMLSAKVIEEKYKERITELENEIQDIKNAKTTMFGLDEHLGSAIGGAISGVSGAVDAGVVAGMKQLEQNK